MSKAQIKKMNEARKPKLVFDSKLYSIFTIPLNYKICIKKVCRKAIPNHAIDRDCYAALEDGLEVAKKMAEETLDYHFIRP